MRHDLQSVPTPRDVAMYAMALGRHPGLPRALVDVATVPDISIGGAIARTAALHEVRSVVIREELDEQMLHADGVVVEGMSAEHVSGVWRRLQLEFDAARLHVPEPKLNVENRLVDGDVRVATRMSVQAHQIAFRSRSAPAYERLRSAQRSWCREGEWLLSPGGGRGVAFRTVSAVPRLDLAVEHLEGLVLAVYEAFWRQRYDWTSGIVRSTRAQVSVSPCCVIRLDPRALAARVFSSVPRGANWRARLLRGVRFIAAVDVRWRTKPAAGERVVRLIDTVVDGRAAANRLGPGESGPAVRAAAAMGDAAFYVVISARTIRDLVGFEVDADGRPDFQLGGCRKPTSSARGIRHPATFRRPYFQHHPAIEVVAGNEGWSGGARRIARQLTQELRPPHATDGDWQPCNGKLGHGYRLTTWMMKSGHLEAGSTARSRDQARFMDDLASLSSRLGLRGDVTLDGVTSRLDPSVRFPPRQCRDVAVRLWLPCGWEEHLREVASAPADVDATYLRTRRLAAGLSQAQVATRLGVSAACVSQWERGKRPVPSERRAWLERLFLRSTTHQGSVELKQKLTDGAAPESRDSPVEDGGEVVSQAEQMACDDRPSVRTSTRSSQPLRSAAVRSGAETIRIGGGTVGGELPRASSLGRWPDRTDVREEKE